MPRLRVLTGPSTSPDALEDISHLVNTAAPHRIQSDTFDGEVVVHIKNFVGPRGGGSGSGSGGGEREGRRGLERGDEYFCWSERKGVTWSIQVRCVYGPVAFFESGGYRSAGRLTLLFFLFFFFSFPGSGRGRFLKPVCADDVMFGNTFDRPLKLPWGSGAALKFMQ